MVFVRYQVKLKNGDTLVTSTENDSYDSVFVQTANGNDFFCLPKLIISKNEVSYIKVSGYTSE